MLVAKDRSLNLSSREENHRLTKGGRSRARFFLILEIVTVIGAITLYLGVLRPYLKEASQASTVPLNDKLMRTLKVCRGDLDMDAVRSLLQQGASPNAADTGADSFTALIVAANKGYPGLVKLLLDSGAEVNAKAKMLVKGDGYVLDGITPLWAAALSGNASIAKMLIEHGADIHARDSRGASVMLAARSNEVVQVFLDQGLDINARDVDGYTLLMLAAGTASGMPDVAFLLDRGADPNAKAKNGATPLRAARGRPSVLELLKKAGAKQQ